MKKLAVLFALVLGGCDPGGYYPNFECTEREVISGYCTKAEYTCRENMRIMHHKYAGPRCI